MYCAPAIAATVIATGSTLAMPVVIDFEDYNGTTPTDDELIVNQYNTAQYLFTTFSTTGVNDNVLQDPAFEQTGFQGTGIEGFVNDRDGGFDTLIAGQPDIGDFFLRSRADVLDTSPFVFIVNFGGTDVPASVAFDLLDLDGTSPQRSERWDVYVTDRLGTRTLALQTPTGSDNMSPFDAEAFNIALFDQDGIATIELEFSGTKDSNIGVGLDNFVFDNVVPSPGPAGLFGLAGLAACRRRR